MVPRLYPILLCALVFNSCRISKVGTDTDGNGQSAVGGGGVTSNPPIIQPQRQVEPGPLLNVNLEDSGKVKESLSLRLDYFPAPRADGISVPTCYEEIAAHLVVARLVCTANSNLAMDVTASQVDQKCYTANPKLRVAAKSSIILAGCQGAATLRTVRYEPDVRLEVGN